MDKKIPIEDLTKTIMEGLEEYVDLKSEEVKKACKKASTTVKKEIKANAPVNTGAYAKSWSVKNVKETSNSISLVVHSRNRYQLAHLLEYGHALRNGGRSKAFPHIKKAEEKGTKQLEDEIIRNLKHG